MTSIKDAILNVVRNPEAAALRAKRGRDKMLAMTPQHYGNQLQALLSELKAC